MANKSKHWPKPKGRTLSASSDLDLYYLSLNLAYKYGNFSKELLADELVGRVKGLRLIKELSSSALDKLLKELKAFGWVDADITTDQGTFEIRYFALTREGERARKKYEEEKSAFLHNLIRKMHKEYTIPGWFVNRLWQLNPDGQGQIIIPTPLKKWNPSSRLCDNTDWDNELKEQTLLPKKAINRLAKGSFEIADDIWLDEVEKSWTRLGKSVTSTGQFSPRGRLTLAMREAAVHLLFNITPIGFDSPEFKTSKAPLEPRSYSAWCPRLDELELIFYTDFNPKVPGRIIFPVASFKKEISIKNKYDEIKSIKNLNDEHLCLHRPSWNNIRVDFGDVLFKETQNVYKRTKALYVSVQDVRDEVCRQLRISSAAFNEYLHNATIESLEGNAKFRISLETDIREDQRNAYQQRRRAVIVNNKLISLIAITKAG